MTEGLVHILPHHFVTLWPGQLGPIGLGELPVVAQHLRGVGRYPFEHLGGPRLDLAGEHVFAFQRPTDLSDVERVHPREPVEIRRLEGHYADSAGRSGHPLGQTCSDREAVGPAAGGAEHGETLESELVCDRGDVGDAIHHPSVGAPVGAAVAGSVIGDHPRPDLGVCALVVMPSEPRPGRTVERKDRETAQVAPLRKHERATISRRNRLRIGPASHDTIMHQAPMSPSAFSRGTFRNTRARVRPGP